MAEQPVLFGPEPTPAPPTVLGSAILSDCERYRYLLGREWADGPTAVFVMLNPSTADATFDASTRIAAWAFTRSMIVKLCDCIDLASTPGKSHSSLASRQKPCAVRFGGKASQSATAEGSPWMIGASPICTAMVRRSTISPINSASVASWSERVSTEPESNAATRLTTAVCPPTLKKSSAPTVTPEVARKSRGIWESRRAPSCESCMSEAFAHAGVGTCWTPNSSSGRSTCTATEPRSVRSVRNSKFLSVRCATPSSNSVLSRRSAAVPAGLAGPGWASMACISESVSKTPTPWPACDKQAASLRSIASSWRAISVAHCFQARRSTTSTTTATTTGLRTCNCGLVSTGVDTSCGAATAGHTEFSLRPSPDSRSNAKPDRIAAVLALPGMDRLSALAVTKSGQPKHPLYLKADLVPQPWTAPTGAVS